MTQRRKVSGADSDLPLVLRAAFAHPDERIRESVRQKLESCVTSFEPWFADEAIRDCLLQQEGTVLEPFVLTDAELEVATLATRLTMSKTVGEKRFRIVSGETIGTDGGLVLTSNLRSFYVERYAHGAHRKTSGTTWYIAPAALSATSNWKRTNAFGKINVTCLTDTEGFTIRVSGANWVASAGQHKIRLVRSLQDHSYVGEKQLEFTHVGLRVDVEKNDILIRTGSPESLLRLSALMSKEARMVLRSGADSNSSGGIIIGLQIPDAEKVTLPSLMTYVSGFQDDWMRMQLIATVPLSFEEKLATSNWLMPHESWMDAQLMDALL